MRWRAVLAWVLAAVAVMGAAAGVLMLIVGLPWLMFAPDRAWWIVVCGWVDVRIIDYHS